MCNCKTKECFEFEMFVWCKALSHTEMWWWREDVIRGLRLSSDSSKEGK